MYAVKSINGFGVFNGHEWLVDPVYRWISCFQCGFAYARAKNGNEYLIDTNGNRTALTEIARDYCPVESVKFVEPNDAIDSPGSLLIGSPNEWMVFIVDSRLQLQPIETFPRECKVAPYFGGNWLITRVSKATTQDFILAQLRSNKIVKLDDLEYIDPPSFNSDCLAVQSRHFPQLWAYYSPVQQRVVDEWFYFAQSFSDGLGLVQREMGAPYEFLDLRLERIGGLEFEWADVFRFGLAAAVKDGVSGYYDQQGICKIPFDGELGRFNRIGHAIVDHGNCAEIIDRAGKSLVGNLESCTFFDGDFPCYHASQGGREVIVTEALEIIPGEIF